MAELTTQERLQPSLLDRLTDQARFKERVWLAIDDTALERAGVARGSVIQALAAHGIEAGTGEVPEPGIGVDDAADCQLFETLAGPRALSRALEAVVDESDSGARVTVADFVRVLDRKSIPNLQESRQDRVMSGKQLRGYVLRDLGWLLNTGNLATVVDLSPFARVQRCVLNYGIPDIAGAIASEADAQRIATAIREAIEAFEPRLQRVLVEAVDGDDGRSGEALPNTLQFVIEATLWARPTPEQLFLRTELDLESADVRIGESMPG